MSYEMGSIEYIRDNFWEILQTEWKYLYRCCLKRMGNNPTLAEDALSQGMLKAWEKVQAGARITNFKAWLKTLIVNHCTDVLRSLGREANRTESIESVAYFENEVLVYQDEEIDPAAKRRDLAKILGGN
jgi:DNA-directed RNA polymerase specialized sigma24 family protein